jgi:hypothetical protein
MGLTLIFLVPAVLVFVFYLPSDFKELLVLRSDSLNALTFFTSHFVHEDFANHLLPNMLVYLATALLLYGFLSMLNERRLFYRLFAFNCLAMPFILSLIWIAVCKLWSWNTRSLSFSGIASAFLGALVFAYALFLNKALKVDTFYAYMSSILLPVIILVLTYFAYFTPATIITITIPLLAAFISLAYKTIKSIGPQAKNQLKERIKNPKTIIIVDSLPYFLYLIIIGVSLSLFPTQIMHGNTIINILIHYVGFILGIGTAQLIWRIHHKA